MHGERVKTRGSQVPQNLTIRRGTKPPMLSGITDMVMLPPQIMKQHVAMPFPLLLARSPQGEHRTSEIPLREFHANGMICGGLPATVHLIKAGVKSAR